MRSDMERYGVNRPLQAAFYLHTSPADQAPTFGLEHIPWAHQSFAPEEYQRKLGRLRNLIGRMNAIEAMRIDTVSAGTFVRVLDSLFTSFNRTDEPVATLPELIGHSAAGPRLHNMVDAGVFSTMPTAKGEIGTPLRDPGQLLVLNPEAVTFDAVEYQALPSSIRDFLDGLNLLLVPRSYNPHRVSVTLNPLEPTIPTDERYVRFYEMLTALGISSIFSIKGAASVPDGYLGIFDSSALVDKSKPVFPQYGPSVRTQTDIEPDLHQMKVTARITGGDNDRVSLMDLTGGAAIDLVRITSQVIEVYVDGNPSRVHDMTKAAALFESMTSDKTKYAIQKPVEVDINQLQKPVSSLERLGGVQMATSLFTSEGQIDMEATKIYHKIAEQLSTGGAIYFPNIHRMVTDIGEKLSEDQLDFIGLGLTEYTLDAISRGQLGDLEGMDQLLWLISRRFGIHPEFAGRVRLYVDNLPTGSITNILMSFDQSHNVTPNGFTSMLRLQSENDAHSSLDSSQSLQTGPKILTPNDRKRRAWARLLDYVQQLLPGIEVDEQLILEIKKHGEIIQIMQGGGAFLRDQRLSPKLGVALTFFCEDMVGRELPDLRKALPYETRRMLESPKLDPGE